MNLILPITALLAQASANACHCNPHSPEAPDVGWIVTEDVCRNLQQWGWAVQYKDHECVGDGQLMSKQSWRRFCEDKNNSVGDCAF
ncbi:hypothetical protein Tdes44962_MAKER09860 [Teratosphaeria destructans]|uniref:Secreted protein n=1 Tax=Teratosphaeria destructans TaxID=418781 RepID=A0A9W7SQS5_9PEZI|nr:hypothetical protein Tdes44962_MAKER09860 [Teratosphaeria destructans]